MTEKQVQSAIRNSTMINISGCMLLENIYLFGKSESDMVRITFHGQVTEYEIKCSRFDYMNDFKKADKHDRFRHLSGIDKLPNDFYYIGPEDMIDLDTVPEYAGLMYVIERGMQRFIMIKKVAPLLHHNPINPDKWKEIAMKLYSKI